MPSTITGHFAITNVSNQNGRIEVLYCLPLATENQQFVTATGNIYPKPALGNFLPTDNAIHFVLGKIGFGNNNLVVDAYRCFGPLQDKLMIPAQVQVIGEIVSVDNGTITVKTEEYVNGSTQTFMVVCELSEAEKLRYGTVLMMIKPGRLLSFGGQLLRVDIGMKTLHVTCLEFGLIRTGKTMDIHKAAPLAGDWWMPNSAGSSIDPPLAPIVAESNVLTPPPSVEKRKGHHVIESESSENSEDSESGTQAVPARKHKGKKVQRGKRR